MVALILCFALGAGAWTQIESNKAFTLEKRAMPSSPYPELRLQAQSRVSPEVLAAAIWRKKDGKYERMKRLSRTLSETPTERVRYEQIGTKVITDRDYTVRQRLQIDRATNVFQMIYTSDNSVGPPPDDAHFVRIEKMSGTWSFEPSEDGGSHVTYICHSDPGGTLPAFLAKGAQIDAAKEVWVEVEAYALAHPDLRL